MFLGSALVSLALLWVGARAGVLEADVARLGVGAGGASGGRGARLRDGVPRLLRHGGVEAARVALRARRPASRSRVGVALYSESETLFWRALAYLAVFHFVRQQYGWVALYRARVGERGRAGWWIDAAAVYMATLYPLVYWHAHLPRRFWWFLPGDFAALPVGGRTNRVAALLSRARRLRGALGSTAGSSRARATRARMWSS